MDEGIALGQPSVDVKCAQGAEKRCPSGCQLCTQVSKTSCIVGARKSFPHPEEIYSLLETTLHGEKVEQQEAKLSPQRTQSIWKQQPVNKKWLFSLLGRYSQQSRSGTFIVIVWCNNTQIEVWFSRYLARHVDLMWIKDYMVEWSKYNQCNMIHSCPAEQMFEQMSGKKKNVLGS